jgi:hypothetical protein
VADAMKIRVYSETSTLRHNIRHDDAKSQRELAALEQLDGMCSLFGSGVVLAEVLRTADEERRNYLIVDHKMLQPVEKDGRVVGFHALSDQLGGGCTYPLVSDVQDEKLRDELVQRGLEPGDANHIVQAVCNDCDVFLTRDERTIIIPHRYWLEARFPRLKVRLPSELLEELTAKGA